ncbi:hypothetical protein ACF087_02280 [Streptomyces goshikiensis]
MRGAGAPASGRVHVFDRIVSGQCKGVAAELDAAHNTYVFTKSKR